MIYIIRDDTIRQSAMGAVFQAELGAVIKISTTPCPRSVQQNATLHMWCDEFIKTGEFKTPDGAPYSLLMMKEEFKEAYLPKKTWTNRKGVEKVMPLSTADLDVTTFSDFLNKIQLTAGKMGIRLRDPALNGLALK